MIPIDPMIRCKPLPRRDILVGVAALGLALKTSFADAQTPPATATMLSGIRRIAVDTVISDDIMMLPGAAFDIADGATLTLRGDMVTGGSRIFLGKGKVNLIQSRVLVARPEWWGAVAGDPKVDCRAAFTACLNAHLAMELGLGDYYFYDALIISQHNRRIWGMSRIKDAGGTRLLRLGGDGPTVIVGTLKAPGSINDYVRGVDMRWLEITRTQTASPITAGGADPATGLEIRYVLDCLFEGLRSNEHAIGYSARGAVRSYLKDCTAFRSTTNPSPAQDMFVGFDLGGRSGAGRSGGNASIFMIDCNASIGGKLKLATCVGTRLTGEISDTFIIRFETASLVDGILIDGQVSQLSSDSARAGHVDVRIEAPVLDQCSGTGIRIANLSDHALFDLRDPYVALAPGNGTAIAIADCGGNVDISGGQLIGWVALQSGGKPTGLDIKRSKGFSVTGLKLLEFGSAIICSDASAFELSVAINRPDSQSADAAISLRKCRNGLVRPRITGRADAYKSAVLVAGDAATIKIDLSAVDTDAIAGDSIAKAKLKS